MGGINYEQNKSEYDFQLFKMQKANFDLQQTNLNLTNRQLKRFYWHSILSYTAGLASAIILHIYTKDTKDIEKLEQRIIIAEQTVNQMKDSIRNAKVLYTNSKDTSFVR